MKIISQEYLDLQKKLHQDKNYGTASIKQAPLVKQIFDKNNFGDDFRELFLRKFNKW